MSIHALHSKASIKGHPVHPMLVGFPIALYTTGMASLITYAIQRDLFWYRGAMMLLFVGVGTALLSAIFGIIDLFFGVPREEKATRRTGAIHFGLNLMTMILFAGAALSLYARWRQEGTGELAFGLPLAIGIIGLALMIGGGALGWKLVQTHHVGIEDPGEAATEAPRPAARAGTPGIGSPVSGTAS